MKIRFTAQADADIADCYLYGYRHFGQHQAEIYNTEIRHIMGLIAANPYLARERPEFDPPVRIHHHARHYIIYVLKDDGILIVRVLRDNVDLTRHLRRST